MFQDPSRRKEGMNLKENKERRVKKWTKQVVLLLFGSLLCKCYASVCLPFIEGCGSFESQHGDSTVDSAAVLASP